MTRSCPSQACGYGHITMPTHNRRCNKRHNGSACMNERGSKQQMPWLCSLRLACMHFCQYQPQHSLQRVSSCSVPTFTLPCARESLHFLGSNNRPIKDISVHYAGGLQECDCLHGVPLLQLDQGSAFRCARPAQSAQSAAESSKSALLCMAPTAASGNGHSMLWGPNHITLYHCDCQCF